MMITIVPFTVHPRCDCTALQVGNEQDKHIKRSHMPITYWGIYLNDKHISYVSSRELAEKTKLWIEKWLQDRL